jgi:hypothetical protein
MEAMIAFIDDHGHEHSGTPICRTLDIAASTFHAREARRRRPDKALPRVKTEMALRPEILTDPR